jgi:hypothetical protein
MNTKAIIGVSILAVVLIVLCSQTSVVGYRVVKDSQQNLINERVNQKDLLFQTICDLANNKEVQKAILESQSKFQNPFPASQLTSFPAITKRQLNLMYFLGLVLFKMMGKARMESLVKAHPITVQGNNKISSIIANNTKLSQELNQLSLLNCPSCNESRISWTFPIICIILSCIAYISGLFPWGLIVIFLIAIIEFFLNCQY